MLDRAKVEKLVAMLQEHYPQPKDKLSGTGFVLGVTEQTDHEDRTEHDTTIAIRGVSVSGLAEMIVAMIDEHPKILDEVTMILTQRMTEWQNKTKEGK